MPGERGFTHPDYVPLPSEIDALLQFLPVFSDPDYEPVESVIAGWGGGSVWDVHLRMFHQAVYDNGFVYPFDWASWQDRAEELLEDPSKLAGADLQTIRMLVTTHVRKERFCEGHLPMMVRCGHIAALLRRLAEIRSEMDRSSAGL
jgi:hypothetical protein